MKPYPPLGILYLCSHLQRKGFDIEVFDTTFSSRLAVQRPIPAILPSCIYANLMTRQNVIDILGMAREAGWRTIVGGPEPGAYAQEYLDSGADFVVFGEGEITMEELLYALQEGTGDSPSKVSGIAFLDEQGLMRRTGPRAQIAHLDSQPWPARQSIDVQRYVRTWRDAHGKGSVSFITARGCPYKCRWCSHQVFGQTHRRRTPSMVVDENQWLMSGIPRHGVGSR
jgi:radical SAM superfamily enzyme YgiQ (UPF0313 family)